jgi:hypothetical protein
MDLYLITNLCHCLVSNTDLNAFEDAISKDMDKNFKLIDGVGNLTTSVKTLLKAML